MERYSQNDEQDIILKVFSNYKSGTFLDIGAYDGKTLSNTHALFLLGWNGVCIEPSPKNFSNLRKLYNETIDCLQIALGPVNGDVVFYDTPGDFYGSMTKGNGERYGRPSTETVVECWTADKLFNEVGYNFDFISLDVEQNNFELLKTIPFDRLKRLKLICIEHDSKQSEIIKYLAPFGFKEIHRTPENILMVKE